MRGPCHLPACGPRIPLPLPLFFPSLPSPPVTSLPLPYPLLPPLRSRLLESSYGKWGSAVSSLGGALPAVSFPSGVWGGAPAEIEFGAF